MASCYMPPISDASECDSRCFSHQASRPFTVMCHQWNCTTEKIHLSPLMYSCAVFRSLKNQSRRPCTTASHYQSHLLTFMFASALSFYHLTSPLIVIVFFCACRCCDFNFCCFLPCLVFSFSVSLFLIIASSHPLFYVAKRSSFKSVQSSLPTC